MNRFVRALVVIFALTSVVGSTTLVAAARDRPNFVRIVGEIDADLALKFEADLDAVPDGAPVVVTIQSPGGSVYSGMDIEESVAERAEHGSVTCVDVGLAASMAGLIFESDGCQTRVMRPGALLHFHLPSSEFSGNTVQVQHEEAVMKGLRDMEYELIARRAGVQTADEIMRRVDAGDDVVLTAQEALAMGLCDRVQ